MRLFVITGTCGAGKSTIIHKLCTLLNPNEFACFDTDELGFSWCDYEGTDRESNFTDDYLKEAVKRSEGKDIVFAFCMNPKDYIKKHIHLKIRSV